MCLLYVAAMVEGATTKPACVNVSQMLGVLPPSAAAPSTCIKATTVNLRSIAEPSKLPLSIHVIGSITNGSYLRFSELIYKLL